MYIIITSPLFTEAKYFIKQFVSTLHRSCRISQKLQHSRQHKLSQSSFLRNYETNLTNEAQRQVGFEILRKKTCNTLEDNILLYTIKNVSKIYFIYPLVALMMTDSTVSSKEISVEWTNHLTLDVSTHILIKCIQFTAYFQSSYS